MATRATSRVESTPAAETDRPYPPSWLDRLFAAIERLPGPIWLYYLLFWVALILVVNLARWVDGSLAWGSFDLDISAATFYGVYILAVIHYLKRVARSSLESFRPAIGERDLEYPRYQYELTTLPARATLVYTALGVALVPPAILLDSVAPRTLGSSPLAVITTVVTNYFGVVLIPVVLYNTLRQFRVVVHLHQTATNIDLYAPAPLYSFSALTARTGIAFLFIAYFSVVTDPTTFTNPVWYGALFVAGAAAVAFFLVPLYSMHRRIVAEKVRLEAEASRRVRATVGDLHQRVDRHDLTDADGLQKTLASLVLERDFLEKIPTWPWEADTIRGFITALLLPIFLWLVTRVLEKFIAF